MNIRQKAKKYKKDADFWRRRCQCQPLLQPVAHMPFEKYMAEFSIPIYEKQRYFWDGPDELMRVVRRRLAVDLSEQLEQVIDVTESIGGPWEGTVTYRATLYVGKTLLR